MEPFPFPPPPTFLPPMATLTAPRLREYQRAMTWFAQERGGRAFSEGSPMARWLEQLERVAAGETLLPVEPGVGADPVRPPASELSFPDVYLAVLAAHAVMVLEGHAHNMPLTIHTSFVSEELGARDMKETKYPAIPSSVGTLLLAARIAHLGVGSLCIHGKKSQGLDVEWSVGDELLRFEVKGRAFHAAYSEPATAAKLRRWAIGRVLPAARDLRRRSESDGVRSAVHIIWLTGFLPPELLSEMCDHETWKRTLKATLKNVHAMERPDAVCCDWYGVGLDGNQRPTAGASPVGISFIRGRALPLARLFEGEPGH